MESFCHRWTATLLFIWVLIQPGRCGVTAYTSSGETHLRVGRTVEIKCDFFKANGLPASGVKIEMIRSKGYIDYNSVTDIPISDNDKVRVNDTTVTVTYRKVLSRADYVAVYTCKLSINEQPDDQASLYITVWDTPTPVFTWKTTFLHIGTSESWTCTVDGATDDFPSAQFLIQRFKQSPLVLKSICPTCVAETLIKYTDEYGLETYKVVLTATLSSTSFTPPKKEGEFIPLYCGSYYGPTGESLNTFDLDRNSQAIRISAPLPPTSAHQPQRGNNAPQAPIANTIVTPRHTMRHLGVGGIAFTNTNPTTTNNNEHLTTTTPSELATTTDNVAQEQYDDDMFEDTTGDKSKKGKSSMSAGHVGGIVMVVMGTVLYVIFVAVGVKWHGKYLERRLEKNREAMAQRRRSSISIQMNVPKRGSDSAATSDVESAAMSDVESPATSDVESAATSDLGSNEAYSAGGTSQYEDSVAGSQSEVGSDVATSEGSVI
ncbi:hypothetical protein V1264_016393 [Littorina saxatilis]|uniref:Uncharacterized protein n=1 Tax=Littorina saxatilis TaxID=31220 RepID=A0AAN9GI40_9CAEN